MKELDEKNIEYNKNIPVGIMIEIPSAALIINELIAEIDFVSIGTNDLVQYTLAVDRNNEKVADFYQPLNPGVIRLIEMVVSACQKKGTPVSICGEMAGDPMIILALLALGVNDFSMQPVSIPRVKNVVLNTDIKRLKKILATLKTYSEISELENLLKDSSVH